MCWVLGDEVKVTPSLSFCPRAHGEGHTIGRSMVLIMACAVGGDKWCAPGVPREEAAMLPEARLVGFSSPECRPVTDTTELQFPYLGDRGF